MPRVRQIFCAVMQTASVKVGNASWSSATCSMVIPAAMQAVRDQLAKAVGAAVGDGAEQVIVAGDAGHHVVLPRGLSLGETYPSVLGVGEAHRGSISSAYSRLSVNSSVTTYTLPAVTR